MVVVKLVTLLKDRPAAGAANVAVGAPSSEMIVRTTPVDVLAATSRERTVSVVV